MGTISSDMVVGGLATLRVDGSSQEWNRDSLGLNTKMRRDEPEGENEEYKCIEEKEGFK